LNDGRDLNLVLSNTLGPRSRFPDLPYVGSIVPELRDPSIRECFVYSYRAQERAQVNLVTLGSKLTWPRYWPPRHGPALLRR